MNRIHKVILAFASISMALSVCLGAFGAHALSSSLTVQQMKTYQTALQYQVYHSLGLLGIVGFMFHYRHRLLSLSGGLIIIGIMTFSGSLYLFLLTGIAWLAMLTPVGGIALILGWLGCALVFVLRGHSHLR